MAAEMGRRRRDGEREDALAAVIEHVIRPRSRDLGGFTVRRALPATECKMIGPFIFFDHMGPVQFAAGQGIDVRPHPHIHLATVTYLFEGEILHRDSLGYVQAIRPGAVNWMTAGRGITHSERSGEEARRGVQRLHGIQSWVALPRAEEDHQPCFVHHAEGTLPVIERGGARFTLIAGRAFGEESPVEVLSPMFYLDAELAAGSTCTLPAELGERGAYVVEGAIDAGGELFPSGTLLRFGDADEVVLRAEKAARVMLFGGQALDGERHIWWNFVSSDPARIEAAKHDWSAGRFAAVPGESEFIPLPDDDSVRR